MIRFYVDTSGKKEEHPVFVAAGYLASEVRWQRFERAWRDILRDAGVRYFHATDFFACKDEFSGWKQNGPEHVRFIKRFTGAAVKHTELGFAFGLDLNAFDDELASVLSVAHTPHDRYPAQMLCVVKCLGNAAQWLRRHGRTAAVIFEDEDGIGEIINYLYILKKHGEGWINVYHSFNRAGKEQRPLQAADLIAHEAWRRLKEHLYPTGRVERKSYTALMRNENVEVAVASREIMRRSAPLIRAFQEANPQYTKPLRRLT